MHRKRIMQMIAWKLHVLSVHGFLFLTGCQL